MAIRATSKSLHAEARHNPSLVCLSAHLQIPKIMHDQDSPVELPARMLFVIGSSVTRAVD